jgi:hypothetical protein
MMVQRRTYSITLRKAFKYLLGQGVHEQALLKGTELARRDLDDPYCQITENQARVFFRNVLANTDQDGIGLEIGWLTGLSDVGQYGLMQISARTVREAVGKSHESRALYYLLGDWDYREEGGELIVSVATREHEPGLHRFVLEQGLGIIQAHAEDLCGFGVKPSKLLLDYARPNNFERYREIFACPIKFNQPVCELYYPAEILDREVETYDPQVSEVLSSLRENLLAKLSSRGDIVHEVKLELRRSWSVSQPGGYSREIGHVIPYTAAPAEGERYQLPGAPRCGAPPGGERFPAPNHHEHSADRGALWVQRRPELLPGLQALAGRIAHGVPGNVNRRLGFHPVIKCGIPDGIQSRSQ